VTKVTGQRDDTNRASVTRLYVLLTQFLLALPGLWVITVGPRRIMNSLFEVVLWGAPVVLLTWALLLAIVCGLAFREEGSPHDPQPF
jgi:hypothetical protein